MSKVFITGSADGIGLIAARNLISQGHKVTLHARSAQRARDALANAPGAQGCLVGDLSSLKEVKTLAEQANDLGRFDTVVHNAGVGFRDTKPHITDSGTAHVFAINVLAPYVLTVMMTRPGRLLYLSSSMHSGGDPSLQDLGWSRRRWSGVQAYSDSKLLDTMLAFAVARLWPDVHASAIDPGWVGTKMGGAGAPGRAEEGAVTTTYLAVTTDAIASGKYWANSRPRPCHSAADDSVKQDELLRKCAEFSGVPFQ